jgi:hypothetical protein
MESPVIYTLHGEKTSLVVHAHLSRQVHRDSVAVATERKARSLLPRIHRVIEKAINDNRDKLREVASGIGFTPSHLAMIDASEPVLYLVPNAKATGVEIHVRLTESMDYSHSEVIEP